MTGRADSLRAIETEVARLLRRVRQVIALRARAVHPELSAGAYLFLVHLDQTGPVRSSALVEEFGIDKGAVSRQLHGLEDLELIAREPDPDDGRATLLALTPDARRRLRRVQRERSARFDDRLADWSDAELAGFVDRLARYNAALED